MLIRTVLLAPLLAYPLWEAVAVQITSLQLSLPGLPPQLDGFSILFVTDPHISRMGRRERNLLRVLRGLQPDLLAVGGDVARHERGMALAVRILQSVKPRLGAFAVLGNSEHKHDAPTEQLVRMLEDGGIHVLNNVHQALCYRGARLVIAGVDDPYEERDDYAAATAGAPSDAPIILLAHSPEVVVRLRERAPDLTLCGHTHGGQVRLPGLNAIYTHNRHGVDLDAGLFTADELRRYNPGISGSPLMYVSRGIGVSVLPVRFLCRPEVALISLRSG